MQLNFLSRHITRNRCYVLKHGCPVTTGDAGHVGLFATVKSQEHRSVRQDCASGGAIQFDPIACGEPRFVLAHVLFLACLRGVCVHAGRQKRISGRCWKGGMWFYQIYGGT
jgi:hypothetical protein